VAKQTVELREVVLKNKPAELLQVSSKATVPVLVLSNGQVLDESRDIMLWALQQHDPKNWLGGNQALLEQTKTLIDINDFEFKPNLDGYKYADRYPESAAFYRQQGELYLQRLEQKLQDHRYLLGEQISLADMAIYPFIRQFAHVDIHWFNHSPYTKIQQWLNDFLAADWFASVMQKYPAWQAGDAQQMFPV